jgi:uncharacterized protein (DUF433 family)
MDTLLVSRDPEVMSGALCFRGTRVPVKNLFDYLEGSSTLEDFLEDFPSISRATAVSVLDSVSNELPALLPLVPTLVRELASLKPKSYTFVKVA